LRARCFRPCRQAVAHRGQRGDRERASRGIGAVRVDEREQRDVALQIPGERAAAALVVEHGAARGLLDRRQRIATGRRRREELLRDRQPLVVLRRERIERQRGEDDRGAAPQIGFAENFM